MQIHSCGDGETASQTTAAMLVEKQTPREMLSRHCSAMVALSVLSFLFTYAIWWTAIFTLFVGAIGYVASEMTSDRPAFAEPPLDVRCTKGNLERQAALCEFFYYATCLLGALQCGGEIMLLLHMTNAMSFSDKNGWDVACIVLGSLLIAALVVITYLAHRACAAMLQENREFPPHNPLLTY
ncbi:hypothetical protein SDRG_14295 [Saprolegnia diclina VS20]|uniref:Uncharacterized protein n=1 Tax=Saprolegnia diclina (strain VS20) TaxID=1156394 RepID=T0PRB7_SAPDV|nr:hypothetical protein SDRG_14295 [Saprolegnia diclina VS20]EQC28024.1 hypothetical protein SDRG_14295 [Saprolegnia diclina VS20]|eukprot:XP_008618637.1 hypothetical protein SDRG_14295 [Saprolegnia diclina VS20]